MQNIPVVFIESNSLVRGHGENPSWFVLAREHATRFNNEVVSISDELEMDGPVLDRVQHISLGTLFHVDERIDSLKEHYQHLSTNPYDFEFFCIARWFILHRYMLLRDIDVALYLDSDVLVFANASEEWERYWNQYDYTLAVGSSPATLFVRRETLLSFIEFVLGVYIIKNSSMLETFKNTFAKMRAQDLPGGISDMALWRTFSQTHLQWKLGEITDGVNHTTWDHNINVSDGYVTRPNGQKDIVMYGNAPYGKYIADNQPTRFKALHFQGGAKKYMVDYACKVEAADGQKIRT